MEECAYISASRLRAPQHLTASIDSLAFASPTRVGDILYIISQVCLEPKTRFTPESTVLPASLVDAMFCCCTMRDLQRDIRQLCSMFL